MVAKQSALKKEEQETQTIQHVESRNPRVVHRLSSQSDPTKLDRLIHERIRLGIVSALAVNESLSFSDLKAVVKTTDGNLSVHARKLEDAEYIECKKTFEGRMPKTEFRLTKTGRKAFERYLAHMEALIALTRNG